MKTTLDIPDPLFREAKMVAARDGTTLRAVVTQALEAELKRRSPASGSSPPPRSFGGMRHLQDGTDDIDRAVEAAFEHVDEEAWQ